VQDDEFEWDDVKAASNRLDHGVTFEVAREAFKDPFAVEWIDDRYASNEHRFAMLAIVENRLLFSARKAEPHERRRYHNENREI